tara:strand:+ start:893 stop:1327 length:435 start_codon:yes stop_codon:yes gene_type:complete
MLKIVKLKKNNINLEKLKFIYYLRNSNYVKKNSRNRNSFTYDNHLKWINKNLIKKNKIFLIQENNINIGYINVIKEKKRNYLSWTVKKTFQGRGYAKKALIRIMKKEKNLFARIIYTNSKSIKLAENCGMKKIRKYKEILIFKL